MSTVRLSRGKSTPEQTITRGLFHGFERIYYIDLADNSYTRYGSRGQSSFLNVEQQGRDYQADARRIIAELVYEEDRPVLAEALRRDSMLEALRGGRAYSLIYRLMVDGAPRWYSLTASLPGEEDTRHLIVGVRNIHEQFLRQQAMDADYRAKQTYEHIAAALSQDFFTVFYVNTATAAYVEYHARPGLQRLDAVRRGEDYFADNRALLLDVDEVDRPLAMRAFDRETMARALAADSIYSDTYRLRLEGQWIHVAVKVIRLSDETDHVIVGMRNIDAQVRRELSLAEELGAARELANRDALTGVKSKHAFVTAERELNARIAHGEAEPFAIAVCDVNGLKAVNDTQGHQAGDRYIQSACRVICEIFRHSPVFRIGGDEFAALLRGGDYERRGQLAEAIAHVSWENRGAGEVVIACGMSDYRPLEDRDVTAVFARADAMMYDNKEKLKSV